ncbi:MAG: single-stranded-DNA-specific exonuclease RecJ, partial [Candidatus Binatia bacterium]
ALKPEDLLPLLEIDGALSFSTIGFPLMREINSLRPFGVGNPEPLFMSEQVEVCERKEFSGGVRFRLRQAAQVLGGVVFGAPEDFPGRLGENLDVVYRLGENAWNGATRVELKIVDARPSASAAPHGLPPQ